MSGESLAAWIGREERSVDALTPERVTALDATLDRPSNWSVNGELPPLRHWLYFWNPMPRSELGRDGHPKLGGFLPDVGIARRMWAGSTIQFHAPLVFGAAVSRLSAIEDVKEKTGRSGRLVFVTVRHELFDGAGTLAITDRHEIVYRADQGNLAAPEPAPADHEREQVFTADSTLLFRYSALTFNGHRIHYDRDYARDVEGYGGLVVHGPLLATLLADFAVSLRPGGRLASFAFRGRRPVLDGQAFRLRAKGDGNGTILLWIADRDGALAMTAEARFAA